VIAVHTPGHTPGGISLTVGSHVLTGDTLFPGGPGLTGWPLSDFPTVIGSIEHHLFSLPDHTIVHPGRGTTTTIGNERPKLPEWIERGWWTRHRSRPRTDSHQATERTPPSLHHRR
jgi:hydroxyacylglutathione hydrolase